MQVSVIELSSVEQAGGKSSPVSLFGTICTVGVRPVSNYTVMVHSLIFISKIIAHCLLLNLTVVLGSEVH